MIKDALMHILGLDERTSDIVELLLVKLNKNRDVETHLLNLSADVMAAVKQMDGIIDHPDDPDNTDMSQTYRNHNTDNWNPRLDKEEAELNKRLTPGIADSEDYPTPDINENHKPSFLQYLMMEDYRAQVDNDLVHMSDEIDGQIDPNDQKRIDAYKKQGNNNAANRLRTQALRRANMNNKQPRTPTQTLVDAKKRQLAQALKVNARNTPTENNMEEPQ